VATWIQAVGTAAATLLAAAALAGGLWDRRRRAASLVSAWVEIDQGVVTDVVLSNRGDVPVFDVIARVIHKGCTIALTDASTLRPGEVTRSLEPAPQVYACAADLMDTATPPRVALLFRDLAGRTWRRRSNGKLRRRRWSHNFATEWLRGLEELPPLVDVDGMPIEEKPSRAPVD
jgi:hypothetical protein